MSRMRLGASALALCLLGLPAAALADTFTGTLNVVWGDPKDRSSDQGGVFYTLATPDGRYIPLEMTAGSDMLALNGKRVVVNGQSAAARAGASTNVRSQAGIVVESIALDASATTATARASGNGGGPNISGSRKVLFVLLKFADDASEARPDPHPASFYLNMTNPDTPPGGSLIPATINGFFKKTSNNVFSWLGDIGAFEGIGGTTWITLPHTKSFYAPCDFNVTCFTGANFNNFNADAAAAMTARGIDPTPYDNINFVLSNDLDCCAWGGTVTIGAKTYGSTWEPPWGQETRVYAHEMGHSIGLPHSGWVYGAYDSPWDVMSDYSDAIVNVCGSYFSRNDGLTENVTCREPGNGYIMAHRNYLGWIPAANQVTVPAFGSVNVSLEGGSVAMGSNLKMIKICLPGVPCSGTGSTTRYFTVEARVKNLAAGSLYDNGIPNEGIIIHDVWFGRPAIGGTCFFNMQSGWAVPVDATPGDFTWAGNCLSSSGQGLRNAQFTPGQTYTNGTYKFKVTVGSRVGSVYNITVQSTLNYSAADFDGDVLADMTLYKANGDWAILKSSSGYGSSTAVNWGGAGYVAVPGDYDGDGRQDPAVYNTTSGQWLALKSSTNYTTAFSQGWGGTGYQAAPGDYDGDGKTDLGLYVPATGQWLVLKSSTGYTTALSVNWGGPGYTAVPGRDFDGDGKADLATYQESTGAWSILKSTTNYTVPINISWGGGGYTLVAGDYDGDGLADAGLYQRATGLWSILKSTSGYTVPISVSWGGLGYDPVPGDFDGDGKFDLAVVQRSTGNWYILKSTTNYASSFSVLGWGAGGDTLVSSAVVPGSGGGSSNELRRSSDFDGDGKADITVYNGSSAYWYTLASSAAYGAAINRSWGGSVYLPAPGDFDGDGKTDYGIYHSISGDWSILLSGSGYSTTLGKNAGGGVYIPVVADYDGDGKSDIGVYNPASGNWFVLKSSTNFTTALSINWGGGGYTATPGDFDGDGKADLGLYQASSGNWYVLLSGANYTTTLGKSAGGSGYVPVQADYDGDGKTDFVVYNTTTGLWYGLKSSTGYTTTLSIGWGGTNYAPVRGDFDGDAKADLAVYQTSTGAWSILLSGAGYTTTIGKSWGGSGYTPVPQYP